MKLIITGDALHSQNVKLFLMGFTGKVFQVCDGVESYKTKRKQEKEALLPS